MENQFDLIVLGGGSGGLAAAKRAVGYGARVAVVEGDRVGGTCVIRGCVPKKLLVYGAMYHDYLQNAYSYGVDINNSQINISRLLLNVRKEVDRLNELHISLLSKSGVKLVSGWGSFNGPNSVLVNNNKEPSEKFTINAEKILIAVGGRPYLPPIQGVELGWTSDDMFLLNDFPEVVVVVGAGFIACEFSCILNRLGINVIQLVRGDNLLRGFDHELSNSLAKDMIESGIEIHFADSPENLKGEIGDITLNTKSGGRINCGGVLFATGRRPFLKDLNLESVGIRCVNNKVPIDSNQMTNIENIYAVGDVTDRFNLTPVAIDEGRAFADTTFGNKKRNVDYLHVPRAVFTQPEIATVGLTEEEANELYGVENIKIFTSKFRPMSKALPKKGSKCLLKLVVQKNNDKILGCHMYGENAAEIVQMAAIPISLGATKEDFDKTMALHPTIAEEFVTMI